MQYLHSRGIVHGDLTGNNVLLKSSSKDQRRFIAMVSHQHAVSKAWVDYMGSGRPALRFNCSGGVRMGAPCWGS